MCRWFVDEVTNDGMVPNVISSIASFMLIDLVAGAVKYRPAGLLDLSASPSIIL